MDTAKRQLYKGKELVAINSGLLVGFVPSGEDIEEITTLPPVEWRGARMPWAQYCEISSFFRLVYQKMKTEATVRLYYQPGSTPETAGLGTWSYAVFPQKATGASVVETKNDPEIAAINAEVHGVQVGSMHSHASMTAFQSGTDLSDEQKSDGIHFTLGKMDEKELDIHVRIMLKGEEYPTPDLMEWIETPEWVRKLPAPVAKVATDWCLRNPDLVEVQLKLVDRVTEPVRAVSAITGSQRALLGFGYGAGTGYGSDGDCLYDTDDITTPSVGNGTAATVDDDDDDLYGPADLTPGEYNRIQDLLLKVAELYYPKLIDEQVSEILEEINEELEIRAEAATENETTKKRRTIHI